MNVNHPTTNNDLKLDYDDEIDGTQKTETRITFPAKLLLYSAVLSILLSVPSGYLGATIYEAVIIVPISPSQFNAMFFNQIFFIITHSLLNLVCAILLMKIRGYWFCLLVCVTTPLAVNMFNLASVFLMISAGWCIIALCLRDVRRLF